MALLPRRIALAALLTVGVAGMQPALAGGAFAATSLGTPGSLAPNSASIEQKDPVLSWSTVVGATAYQVELSKSSDWSDAHDLVTLPNNGSVPVTSFAVPQTLVHGVYFWRVRATDSSDNGSWSANAQLDRAWDDAPSTAGSTPGHNPSVAPATIASAPWRFAWTALPDASSYEVDISTEPTFPQPATTQSSKENDDTFTVDCLTQATSYTPYSNDVSTKDANVDDCDYSTFNPLGATTLYWRVRGVDDSQTAQVSAANQTDTLECAGLPVDPADPPALSTLTALGSPASAGQECSDWSSTQTFSMFSQSGTTASPSTVSGLTLNCPTGTVSDYACAASPEISWQPTANAFQYAVTIADDKSFTNIERSYTTPFLSLTPRDQLADYTAGKGYYVAVQACSAPDESTSPVTPSQCGTASEATFTKQTPTLTGLTATKVQGGVRLSWNDLATRYTATTAGAPAVEAEDYVVKYTNATDTGFDNASSVEVDAACDATVETCYTPGGAAGVDQAVITLPKSGSYIWSVSPVDLTGNVLPASYGPTAITVDLTAPAFHIASKSGVAVTGPITIAASEPVSDVSASTVKLVPQGKSVASAVAGKLVAGSTANTWTFTPTSPLATGGTYVLSVTGAVHDTAGNLAVVTGSSVRTATTAANTSKGWTYSAGWKKHSASGALSGSYREAAKGKTAKLQVEGSSAELIGCKGPNMGKVTVTVGGHSQTVSEHQSYTRCGQEIWHRALAAGTQTLTVKVATSDGNVDEVKIA